MVQVLTASMSLAGGSTDEPALAGYEWLEWQCPLCGHRRDLDDATGRICPNDGSSFREVPVSLPFVWLG